MTRISKNECLKKVFATAKELKIDTDTLRDDIAPSVTGKRLSTCTAVEVVKVIDHLQNYNKPVERKKYDSSLKGLKEEIADIALARFGPEFEGPLNALCKKFNVTHYKWLKVSQAKEIKKTLTRLQEEGPYERR